MNTRQKIVAGSILGIISLGTVVGGYAIASKTPWKSDNPLAHFYSSMILRSKTPVSMLKRNLSESILSKEYWSQCREMALKVLTHNIMIVLPV